MKGMEMSDDSKSNGGTEKESSTGAHDKPAFMHAADRSQAPCCQAAIRWPPRAATLRGLAALPAGFISLGWYGVTQRCLVAKAPRVACEELGCM